MLKEACSSGEFVAAQLSQDRERLVELGQFLRATPPSSVVTVARGSSA